MTDDTRNVISWALQRAMSEGLADTLAADVLDALAAKGLAIQSADEADARVAAAERKGMERAQSEPALISALEAEFRAGMEKAAVIADEKADWHDPTRAIAAAIRAEGENDDG